MTYMDTAYAFIIYMTNRCNLGCTYCFSTFNKAPFKGDLTSEVIDALPGFINSLKRKEIHIVFFGGEPLIRWDICKDVYYKLKNNCPDKKFNFILQTNGTLLDQYINEIKNMEDIDIFVSWDGDEEHHNAYRKFLDGNNSWNKIKNNVDNLLAMGLQNRLTVVYTYMPNEGKKLYENVVKLYNLGVRAIRTSIVKEVAMTHQDMEDIKESTKKIADFVIEVKDLQYHKLGRFNLLDKQKPQEFYDMIYKDHRNPFACYAGTEKMFVGTNGDIFPCSSLINPINIIGNIITGPKQFANIIRKAWECNKCSKCDSRAFCLVCIHRCRLTTGSLKNTCPKIESEYTAMHKEYVDYFYGQLKKYGYVIDRGGDNDGRNC